MQQTYNFKQLEKKIQEFWQENKSFKAIRDTSKEKFYSLSMLPYPSGTLHMGHVRNYTLGDVVSRYQRMLGKNVLQPMGWDAFGLPAENAAIKHKKSPADWTYSNIAYMKKQMQSLGFAYDWDREINTCDSSYYKWEQWFFIKLYKTGLIYRKSAVVNWDPIDQTVLANEQVVDGKGWRSGALIEKKEIPQWFIKITDYAEELLTDLDKLQGWPEAVKIMQTNWIGKSKGITVSFDVDSLKLDIFTTRPDTLMGVTYLAIAAEHPLALQAAENYADIAQFIKQCQHNSTMEAHIATQEKLGIKMPFHATHPITGDKVEIWIANFVLMSYGTGAIMAVPAHDQRDWEFAHQYNIRIQQVIKPTKGSNTDLTKRAITEKGILINSGEFNSLSFDQAIEKISQFLVKHHKGEITTHFRIRDWGVSRQRYWGCPIPIIHCKSCGIVPENEKNLPVKLPQKVKPDSTTSTFKIMPDLYETNCPQCGNKAKRETDTLDTFMESSWYYARYTCPTANKMLDDEANYWLPVDQYIGGIEHAIMHLLYARFFHKLMQANGLVNSPEPFTNLLTQGMVLKDTAKMSKSKGNTVDPQILIERYGADTVRLFSMFAAPPEQSLEWSDSGVEGAHRFLKKVWGYIHSNQEHITTKKNIQLTALSTEDKKTRFEIHSVLKQALFDFDKMQFNTVISACMKIFNSLQKAEHHIVITEGVSILLRLLAPFTPHIAQDLWSELELGENILYSSFPQIDTLALITDKFTLVIQINGKLRTKIDIASELSQKKIELLVITDKIVSTFIAGKTIKKVIYVPKKLINLIVEV